MYHHIMVPVDLAEKDRLARAIAVACDLAGHYGARLTLVSVSGGLSAAVSHNAVEYGRRLADFAAELSAAHDMTVETLNIPTPDPAVDVDGHLRGAIASLGADLVVTGSHMPGWSDYIIASHSGRLAAHAPVSVMVVRG